VGDQKIYQMLYNASSLTGFLIWLGIAICHLRFRRAWVAQGNKVDDLLFKAKFYPYGTWLSLLLFVAVLFGANAGVFSASPFSWFDFISSYLMIPVFILLYGIHKWIKKTRVVPLQRCRF
jgi:lysine-specific permease